MKECRERCLECQAIQGIDHRRICSKSNIMRVEQCPQRHFAGGREAIADWAVHQADRTTLKDPYICFAQRRCVNKCRVTVQDAEAKDRFNRTFVIEFPERCYATLT